MGFNKKFFTTGGIVASSAAAPVINTDNFAPVTYTGNGGTQSISSLDFQPDLVWIKGRDSGSSSSGNPVLFDSVRGLTAPHFLASNFTYGEFGNANSGVTSFNSNGFTVVDDANGGANVNGASGGVYSNGSYVAWCWKAAGAANTFNVLEGGTVTTDSTASGAGITAGTITTGWEVSANRDAGFSIVSYTGSATANQTIGHGLLQTPELIIVKNRDETGNGWAVQSSAMGGADWHMLLNSTQERRNNVDWIWNDTEPTSTVFTVGQFGLTNQSPDRFIAYCFHSVDGYQKVGSYQGSGVAGKKVYTDSNGDGTGTGAFQPRFIIIKRTDSATDWYMIDSLRGGSKVLWADLSNSEETYTATSFDSNGFTLNWTHGYVNALNGTYIYLAIA